MSSCQIECEWIVDLVDYSELEGKTFKDIDKGFYISIQNGEVHKKLNQDSEWIKVGNKGEWSGIEEPDGKITIVWQEATEHMDNIRYK